MLVHSENVRFCANFYICAPLPRNIYHSRYFLFFLLPYVLKEEHFRIPIAGCHSQFPLFIAIPKYTPNQCDNRRIFCIQFPLGRKLKLWYNICRSVYYTELKSAAESFHRIRLKPAMRILYQLHIVYFYRYFRKGVFI